MKKIYRRLAALLSVITVTVFAVSVSNLKLSGLSGAEDIAVQAPDRLMLVPCGTPFGIKMFTEGVMVVGMSDIDIEGDLINPSKNAGIKIGDIILEIDNQEIESNEGLGKIISESMGRQVSIKLRRKNTVHHVIMTPAKSRIDNKYKAGLWVRDSSAGIGTMTFYDPQTKLFGGLGHAICDIDTGDIMPLSSGEVVEAVISGVSKGSSGYPGELKGMFVGNVIGELRVNCETGIFGILNDNPEPREPLPMAYRNEVKEGAAAIYATVNGNETIEYNVIIEKINYSDSNPTKNMVIKITGQDLIEKTGGIVQGMSGCPIIQNGMLIGAVTHVFVNDPTRGYGIFVENMINSSNIVINY